MYIYSTHSVILCTILAPEIISSLFHLQTALLLTAQQAQCGGNNTS